MDEHKKKMIAPIIITVLVIIYYGGMAFVFLMMDGISILASVIFAVLPLAIVGVMIGVLRSRIKEIRSGEEDDLSQY